VLDIPDWIIAIALGVVGGLIRVAISRTWVWPHRLPTDDGRPGFDLGSVGHLITGGASGFVLWALVTRQLFADQGFGLGTIAATILVGLGGGEALMSLLNKMFGVATSQQADQQANQETRAIAERQARAIDTLTQDLSECQERERRLREEVEKLRQSGTPDNQRVE
jgi:hypothetical protein